MIRIGLLLVIAVLGGCHPRMEMTYYSTTSVPIGESAFLHRITQEGTYDHLWLSSKGDHCHSPSSADIDLGDGNVPLYYQLRSDGSLVMFTTSALNIPASSQTAVRNEIVRLQDWIEIENRQTRGEIQKITVTGPSDVCLGPL